MKKTVLIILFIAIIFFCFIPFNKQVILKVNATYFNCYQQLTTLQNWKNWQPDVNKIYNRDSSLYKLSNIPQGKMLAIPGKYFIIKQKNSNSLLIKKVSNENQFNYSYTIIPGNAGLTTTIIVIFKSNIIKYLIPAFNEQDLKETAIYDFKKFMENTKQYYGFSINSVFINEKKIIVKQKNISVKDIYIAANEMQKELQNYILLKHVLQQGPLMIQYIPKQKDSLQMMVGIPVNKPVIPTNGFLYMYMPPTNALIGTFKGKYKDKPKIYTAMTHYIQDKYQHIKIAPYEIFLNKLPISTNDVVEFQLNCPVF